MLIIEIDNKEYELAESWDDITVAKFEKISKHNGFLSEYKSKLLFGLELYAILLDCDVDVIRKLDRASYEELNELTKWLSTDLPENELGDFNINGEKYVAIKEFNQLTMGESISLEMMINESDEFNIFSALLPILIRPAKVSSDGTLLPSEFVSEKYDEYRKLFSENIVISEITALTSFFSNGVKTSSTTTRPSLIKRKKVKK